MAGRGQPVRATGAAGDASAPRGAQGSHAGRIFFAKHPAGADFDRSSPGIPEGGKRPSVPTMPLSDVPCRNSRRIPVRCALGFAGWGLVCTRRVALSLAVFTALLPSPTTPFSTISTGPASLSRERPVCGTRTTAASAEDRRLPIVNLSVLLLRRGATEEGRPGRRIAGGRPPCLCRAEAVSAGVGEGGSTSERPKVSSPQSLDRPYACTCCGKGFSQSSSLTAHMRIHTGDRPYACTTCGKAFRTSGNLASHMRTHTGVRPYVCTLCGKDFTRSDHLGVHMRTHSGDRPFGCTTCGKAFSTSGNLVRHRTQMHSVDGG
ncbi:hypothetical protein T484DRAFT_3383161 [Baffinella frigidus]|nr:hypothetical protein T484DRAFT_3383161 [Cryptophyta sp. CCMP2293]